MLPDEVYEQLLRLAAADGRRLSDVVRDAAQSFVTGRSKTVRRLRFAATGSSGTGDVSVRAEEYLAASLSRKHEKASPSQR